MFVNNRDEMSNVHRGHSIDASYQVSVHLTKRFQIRRFKKIGHSETRTVAAMLQAILVSDWLIAKQIFSVKRKINLAIISLRN
jgi:hypothetical protein